MFRSISTTLGLACLLAITHATHSKELSVTLGSKQGNYKESVKQGNLNSSEYLTDVKPFPVKVKLTDGKIVKAKSNYAYSSSTRCVIHEVEVRLAYNQKNSMEDAKRFATAFATQNGLTKAWDKELKAWDPKKQTRFSFDKTVGKDCKIAISISKGWEDNWSADAKISLTKEATLKALTKAMSGQAIPPHRTATLQRQMGRDLSISPDNSTVALCNGSGVTFLETKSGKAAGQVELGFSPDVVTFSPNGELIWVTSDSNKGKAEIWNWSEKKKITEIIGNATIVPAFNKAVVIGESAVEVISVADKKVLCTLEGDLKGFRLQAVSDDSKAAVLAKEWGSTSVFSLESGKKICTLEGIKSMRNVAFMDGGATLVACGHMVPEVKFWDARTGKSKSMFKPLSHSNLAVSLDNTLVACSSWSNFYNDEEIRLYTPKGQQVAELGIFPDSVSSMAFSPDGKFLIAAMAHSENIYFWELSKLNLPK